MEVVPGGSVGKENAGVQKAMDGCGLGAKGGLVQTENVGEGASQQGIAKGEVPEGWFRDEAGKLRPVKGEAMSFDFDMGGGGGGFGANPELGGRGGLQDNFRNFRREKLKAAKERAARERDEGEKRKDPAAMQDLREKFVDQCKSYYGVPYAKRYHEPDSPHYSAPLFLDCCGLVRQVLRDLKDDFGFTPGPWNQAYQFDTLPVRYDTWDKMKPGDLIFAEGKYKKEGVKPQKGDIVHIEVFLGGGPEGMSCLGARWGKGVVQEFESWNFEAKSWNVTKWHFCSLDTWLEGTCRSFHPEREWKRREWAPGARSIFNAEGEEGGEEEADEGAGGEDAEAGAGDAACAGRQAGGSGGDGRLFYVSRGNQWDLVAGALEGQGCERIPFDEKQRNDYFLKWTEVRGDIDFTRFSDKSQLVNHIPNAGVVTSKLNLIKTLRDRQRVLRKEAKQAPPGGQLPMKDYFPESFTLTLGSDKIALLNACQAALRGDEGERDSAWIIKPAASNCGRGIVVTRDHGMVLRDYLCWRQGPKMPAGAEGGGGGGGGDAPSEPGGEEGHFGANENESKVVIQRYITDPLLLEGRKFDVRCYMLIASTKPYLVLYRDGYVRRSLSPYQGGDLGDRFAHLTNAAVQKKHERYAEMKEDSIWSMRQLQEHLETQGLAPAGWVDEQLSPAMMRACSEVFESARPKLQRRRGFFELLGVDFVVDEGLRPWLLEVNTNPALFVNSKVQEEVIPPTVRGTLDVVVAAWEQTREAGAKVEAGLLPGMEGFRVICDESAGG